MISFLARLGAATVHGMEGLTVAELAEDLGFLQPDVMHVLSELVDLHEDYIPAVWCAEVRWADSLSPTITDQFGLTRLDADRVDRKERPVSPCP